MLIPGELIALLTFPGVIVHEIAHQYFCRLFRVAVLDVCYFRYGNPAGYVLHETPRSKLQHVLIGVGPFIINSIIGALIALPSAIPVLKFSNASPIDYLLIWLGVSISMHSFPSKGGAQAISDAIESKETSPLLRAVVTPIVWIIRLGAWGSVVWLDLVYGLTVAMILPNLLIWLLS